MSEALADGTVRGLNRATLGRVATALAVLALSAAAVLGLTLAGAREPSAILAAWAIITSSVKFLYDSLGELW